MPTWQNIWLKICRKHLLVIFWSPWGLADHPLHHKCSRQGWPTSKRLLPTLRLKRARKWRWHWSRSCLPTGVSAESGVGAKLKTADPLPPHLAGQTLQKSLRGPRTLSPHHLWSSARWLHCNIRWWATPGRQQVFIIRNCWRMGRKWLRLCGLIWLCRMHRLQNGPAVCHYWILLGWRMWISLQALMMVEILTSKMILHEWKLNQTNPRSRMQMMALTSPNISKSMKWWVASSRTRVASSTIPCFRILFQMCLTLFSRGEGGKHFDDVQAFNWVYDILRWVTASGQSVMDTWRL